MAKRRQRHLAYDILEHRTLLSGAHGAVKEHAHARALLARREAAVAARPASIDPPTSPVTGGGLFTVGPAPSTGDIQSIQQAAITNNTVMFLTQLDVLSGTNPNIQQTSASILNDARNLDLAIWNLANTLGVNLPADIEGNDVSIAKQVALSANGGSFDQTYLSALNQVGTTLSGQLQQMETGAQAAAIRSFAATVLPIVQADIAAAQATATGNGSSSLTPVGVVPNSPTIAGADLASLETSYSMNLTERFLAQFTTLVTGNYRVQRYDSKLMSDHEMMAVQEGMYAAATGTYLPASITGMDIPMSMMLVNASGTRQYNRVYLKQMVTMHTIDLDLNNMTLSTTQNPEIRVFAMMGAATDVMHRQGAALLLKQFVR
jgi:predicted outer membrane protein